MQIGIVSRHCKTCQKNVIDFTEYSREAILAFLLTQPGQSQICGRFYQHQLDKISVAEIVNPEFLHKLPTQKAFALLTAASLFLASCQNQVIKEVQNLPEPIENVETTCAEIESKIDSVDASLPAVDNATVLIETITMGDVEFFLDTIPEIENVTDTLNFIPQSLKSSLVEPLFVAEKMPEFPGGIDSLHNYLSGFIRLSPEINSQLIDNRLIVRFVVNTDGKAITPEVISTQTNDQITDWVAQMIDAMPAWIPGENHGKSVPVFVALAIQSSSDN